ncbi:MAG: hypothetical protein ABR508_02835 [Candidatus Baltobacteraceae bacterium]
METGEGLSRALSAGDYVILSTGAIARVSTAYPQGYHGPVEMTLDGQPMSELAATLVLPDNDQAAARQGDGGVAGGSSAHASHVREPHLRMED